MQDQVVFKSHPPVQMMTKLQGFTELLATLTPRHVTSLRVNELNRGNWRQTEAECFFPFPSPRVEPGPSRIALEDAPESK